MGLDWNPLPKPKPGYEEEFAKLLRILSDGGGWRRKSRQARFEAISINAYETLGAPVVGRSAEANKWALDLYEERKPPVSKGKWLESLHGFYVIPLVPACDGIPYYSNGSPGGYVEPFAFRGKFLDECEDILGTSLLGSAYETKLADETKIYANHLFESVQRCVEQSGIAVPSQTPDNPDCLEFRLHVVDAAARWCRWWSERGHGLEAYF